MSVLETDRLILREANEGDAAFMLALLNEPSFIANIGDRGVRTVEAARDYIVERLVAGYVRHGFGMWVVESKETGEAMGLCGLVRRDALDDVDVGFAFLPAYWSKGYAIESASAAMRHAREALGIERVVGIVSPGNESSIRVLEKLGMRFERMVLMPGDTDEIKLFAP